MASRTSYGNASLTGLALEPRTVDDTPYAVGGTNSILNVDTTAARAINLEAASVAGQGRLLVIKDATGNAATKNITVWPAGAETIDGLSSVKIDGDDGWLMIYCDGSGWHVVGTEGSSDIVVSNAMTVVPNPRAVTGTVETLCGAVRLPVRKVPAIRAYLGEETGSHQATLRIRRASDGVLLTDLNTSATPAEVSTSNVDVTSAGWYSLFLLTDDAAGTAICDGVTLS